MIIHKGKNCINQRFQCINKNHFKKKNYSGGLFFYEIYKSIVINKGGIILLLFLIMQICSFFKFSYFIDKEEFYYKEYSKILSGSLTEEKIQRNKMH